MDTKHSRIAPSSAGVWVKCPGSVTMKEACPELPREVDHNVEGDAAHWLAAQWLHSTEKLLRGATSLWLEGAKNAFVNTNAPNGFVITEEIADHINGYILDIISILNIADIKEPLHIEETVYAPRIHAESEGTADTWCFDQSTGTIYIWDFKYGYGIVEVFGNWQLINYALGIIDLVADLDPNPLISMRIVQPRPYHKDGPVREWRTTAHKLRKYADQLRVAAIEALGPDPTVTSGSHCQYCSARASCPAAHKAAMSAIDHTMQAGVDKLPPDAMASELQVLRRTAEAIKYRLTGLEAEAMSQIKNGEAIPGWALDVGLGNAVWTRPAEEVFALGDMIGKDLRKVAAPITPAQAKKAGVDKATIDAFSIREGGALKLVPADNTLGARVFGKKGG